MSHSVDRLALSIAALVVATVTLSAQSAKVSGTVAVNAAKATLQTGSAISYMGPSGRLTSVLLSDKAPNAKEFAEATRVGAGEPLVPAIFEGAWKGMHLEKALSGFTFTITADKTMLTNEILMAGDPISIDNSDLVLELTSVSPRLVGRVRAKDAVLDLGSYKVSLDATFDIEVASR